MFYKAKKTNEYYLQEENGHIFGWTKTDSLCNNFCQNIAQLEKVAHLVLNRLYTMWGRALTVTLLNKG